MVEPSGVSGRAPFANWTHRHSCGGGAFGFPFFGPCDPGPNSPSLEYAELAWAPDAEGAHSCIVRGRHGSTEGLLNLFQPGKKNAWQHLMPPVHGRVDLHRLCSASPVLAIRLATQRRRGFLPPHPNASCFGPALVVLLSLFQSCANGPRCVWDRCQRHRGSRREQAWSLSAAKPAEG
jgi:hypothetical protein